MNQLPLNPGALPAYAGARTLLDATSAYYRAMPGVRLLRLVLGATERLWPAMGVRAATRLFLTPLPFKWLNRRADWADHWRIERWPFEGASLTLYSQPSKGPVVLLVHGWGGHAGQMRTLADALAAQGKHPIIVDMPAHGRSGGMRSSLPQFARALSYLVTRLTAQGHGVQALVAHSLGATAAAHAAGHGLGLERLVLIAPAASPPAYTRMFARVFGLSEQTRGGMQRRIEAREGMLMAQFEAQESAPRIAAPTLVLHDHGDTVNPFADGEAFAAALARGQLVGTDGLGHRAILKDGAVATRVVAFLTC